MLTEEALLTDQQRAYLITLALITAFNIMKQEIQNFSFVQASLHLTFKALTEIAFLNKARTVKEIELINGPPFEFYRISLQYMFVMEYTKLLESKNKYPTNHIASLEKLSDAIYKEKGKDFEKLHDRNLEILTSIKYSNFYIKLRGDRDKKFVMLILIIRHLFHFTVFLMMRLKQHLNN